MSTEHDRTSGPLAAFGSIQRAAVRVEWSVAQAAGLEMWVVDDGRILLGSAPSIASTQFNRGLGFAEAPNRIAEAVAFFEAHGVAGEIALDPNDVPHGVGGRLRLDVYLGDATAVEPTVVEGFASRVVADDEAEAWFEFAVDVYAPSPEVATLWRAMAPPVAERRDWILVAGERDGRLVAISSLVVADGAAWLSWAAVTPSERGRGIQRAMIADRAAIATERGCDRVASWALADAHSSRNLAQAGLERIGQRVVVPAADLG